MQNVAMFFFCLLTGASIYECQDMSHFVINGGGKWSYTKRHFTTKGRKCKWFKVEAQKIVSTY